VFEKQIRLFGKEYLLIGDLQEGGPIATRSAYENFECAFAHLMPDGRILRFGEQIGTREDIEVLPVEVEIDGTVPLRQVLRSLDLEEWSAEERQKDA
jgi:hypothetical protein